MENVWRRQQGSRQLIQLMWISCGWVFPRLSLPILVHIHPHFIFKTGTFMAQSYSACGNMICSTLADSSLYILILLHYISPQQSMPKLRCTVNTPIKDCYWREHRPFLCTSFWVLWPLWVPRSALPWYQRTNPINQKHPNTRLGLAQGGCCRIGHAGWLWSWSGLCLSPWCTGLWLISVWSPCGSAGRAKWKHHPDHAGQDTYVLYASLTL